MPAKDLQTIDALWKLASDGKFGFSVQREIFNQTQRRWPKFFKQVNTWVLSLDPETSWPHQSAPTLEHSKEASGPRSQQGPVSQVRDRRVPSFKRLWSRGVLLQKGDRGTS